MATNRSWACMMAAAMLASGCAEQEIPQVVTKCDVRVTRGDWDISASETSARIDVNPRRTYLRTQEEVEAEQKNDFWSSSIDQANFAFEYDATAASPTWILRVLAPKPVRSGSRTTEMHLADARDGLTFHIFGRYPATLTYLFNENATYEMVLPATFTMPRHYFGVEVVGADVVGGGVWSKTGIRNPPPNFNAARDLGLSIQRGLQQNVSQGLLCNGKVP